MSVVRFQRWIVGAGLLLVVVAGLVWSLPYFIPAQDVRAAVSQSLASLTGATTPFEGEARLSLLPRPAIRLDGLRLGNSNDGFSAGSVSATIRLLPLFFGEVEIGAFVFERPRLRLQIDSQGVRVAGLPVRFGARAEGKRADLRIVDGTIEVQRASGERERLTNVDGLITWRGELAARTSFRWRDAPVTAVFVIADPAAFGDGSRSPFRVRLETEPVRISFEGGLLFRKGIQAEGTFSAEAPSARAALLWAGIEPPTNGGFGPFTLRAQAALTPTGLSLSPLVIDLDGNRAQGGLTLSRDGPRPLLQGTLASDIADFSRYADGFPLKGPDGRAWSEAPLDVKALSGFDLDLRFSAAKVGFNKTEFERVAIGAALRDSRFSISVGDAQLFGGALRAAATISPATNGAQIKLEANLKGFDAAKGLGELAGIRRMEGLSTLSLSLGGGGKSVAAIARSLQGQAQLSVENGAMTGINVEQILRRLEHRAFAGAAELRGGRTPFDKFVAKLDVREGNANVQAAELQNAAVRVKLSGLASIAARDLDLRGTASLIQPPVAGADATTFDLPFLLRGSWDDPSLTPDPAALIRRSDVTPY